MRDVAAAGKVTLFLRAPDQSVVPERAFEMSADDTKLKMSKLSEKDRAALYKQFVCSFSLAYVASVFEACPFLEAVEVHTFVPSVDPASGAATTNVLLTAQYPRESVATVNMSLVDPDALLQAVGGSCRDPGKKAKPLPLAVELDEITWITGGDRPAHVPFGLVDGQEEWESTNEFSS
jgi:hypothetical protein